MKDEQKPMVTPARQVTLDRMEEYERRGGDFFFENVEDDPPTKPLHPEDVDYLGKKWKTKLRRPLAYLIRRRMSRAVMKSFHVKIVGEENLRGLGRGGLIITSNHFSPFENVPVRAVSLKIPGRHRFFAVIREGNWYIPGLYGFLLHYCDTLPLSSVPRTVCNFNRAVETYLAKGAHILVYPEQAMWHNFKKPRPYKIGAYYMAAKNNVPVLPCFITLRENGGYEPDGTPAVDYTMHILPPLYPDPALSVNENADRMREKNAALTRALYEEVYGIPLTYTCGGATP